MNPPEAGEGTRKLEDRYKGYSIVDPGGKKLGTTGGLFVDEHDGREYVEVQVDWSNARSAPDTTCCPWNSAR